VDNARSKQDLTRISYKLKTGNKRKLKRKLILRLGAAKPTRVILSLSQIENKPDRQELFVFQNKL